MSQMSWASAHRTEIDVGISLKPQLIFIALVSYLFPSDFPT